MSLSDEVSRHLLVRGRMQGVGFRGFVLREAEGRAVGGWVRNLADGRVEALLCGSQGAVAGVICRIAAGPPAARVEEVQVEQSALRAQGFELRVSDE